MHTSPLLLKIGSNIKEARRKRQMTQLALAVLCQFEKASISKIESGKRNISILTLEKISQALDVEIGEFFK
jgi:transcriptional regulator with XRE-family HTH domain